MNVGKALGSSTTKQNMLCTMCWILNDAIFKGELLNSGNHHIRKKYLNSLLGNIQYSLGRKFHRT